MDMFQISVLGGVAAYLGYTYLLPLLQAKAATPAPAGGVGTQLSDLLNNLKTKVESPSNEHSIVEVVRDWEILRDAAERDGNEDAVQSLDEIFKLLNTKAKKKGAL